MRRSIAQLRPDSLRKRLSPLVFASVGFVVFILLLTWATNQMQTAFVGLLNGESLWSKAQKQVVVDLLDYAGTGDPAAYADFQSNMATMDALSTARDMVSSGHFTYQTVKDELRRGHAMPVALTNIVFLWDYFARAPYVRDALALWRTTDDAVAELNTVGDALHQAYASGTLSLPEIARQRARINELNKFIRPRSNQFSVSIAHASVMTGRILFAGVVVLAAAALVVWLLIVRRVLAGIRSSEERYRLLFDSAPDAIVMVDEESGRILDANRTAGDWTGRDARELRNVSYSGLFEPAADGEQTAGGGELRSSHGGSRPVETQSSMTVWGEQRVRQAIIRDITERVESDRERRIAAEALASIAEGVIIADAGRKTLSANAAAEQITGFPPEQLVGMRFDETRRLHDGGPLPAAIWDEIIATHHWSGEVESRRRNGSSYAEQLSISTIRDAEHRVLHYVAVFSDISAAKADQNRLQHLAEHDALTGLVNRAEFQRRCEAAIERADRERHAAVVLFIDLDAFKFVNDSYSHAVGDSLLKLVAERIRSQLRGDAITGRIGGDEFTVLLPRLAMREDAASLADRMVSALSEPFNVEGYEIVLGASIGIAGFPLDGTDAPTLIANADAAMYAAKVEERNAWRFYMPTMQADTRQRLMLATELRQALQKEEFRVVYQPSVELRTGRIVAAEALLRWQHPERGEVSPGEFIPIAESIGMIHRIDEWVMNAVCAQIRAWDTAGVPQIRVAINVSARWFGHPGFVESVRRALQTNGVPPQRIALEITEGAMLRLGEETEHTMRALHALGIGVAIDDFGTGYSSMAYLKLPAVAYLKIDRSFVSGLPGSVNDAAITTAMLAMASSLGLVTIAEGVETEAQHEFLARAGSTEGQGYLYSYPLPPTAVEHMLRPRQNVLGTKLRVVPPCRS